MAAVGGATGGRWRRALVKETMRGWFVYLVGNLYNNIFSHATSPSRSAFHRAMLREVPTGKAGLLGDVVACLHNLMFTKPTGFRR